VDINTILLKSGEDWTNEEFFVVRRYIKEHGRVSLKTQRMELMRGALGVKTEDKKSRAAMVKSLKDIRHKKSEPLKEKHGK